MLCVEKQRRVFEMYRAKPYRVVVHLLILKLLFFIYGICLRIVLHAECVESSIGRNGEMAKRGQDDTVLPSVYPVHMSVS